MQLDLLRHAGRPRSVHVRAAQHTGRVLAERRLGQKMRAYLDLLYHRGPKTDQDAADILSRQGIVAGLSSVNSIRNAVCGAGLVHAVDVQAVRLPGSAPSKRTVWDLTPAGRAAMARQALGEGANG